MDLDTIIWIDLETTGLDEQNHGIIEMAGMVEKDFEITDEFHFQIKPVEHLEISQKALKINNYTRREIKGHTDEDKIYQKFYQILMENIDRYDKNSKSFIGGYNVEFDMGFLNQFWYRHCGEDQHLGAFVNRGMKLDPYCLIPKYIHQRQLPEPPSMSLEDVCNFYLPQSDYNWHTAKADVSASRDLYYWLMEEVG